MTDRGDALNSIEERILGVFDEAARVQSATGRSSARAIADASALMCTALSKGGKVIVFGNGGSAADSQHFAAELVGRFQHDRQPLSAVALTTDSSVITAVGNDYAYDLIFTRQLTALGRPGDVALGISTSGRSVNVLKAFGEARRLGIQTVALVGKQLEGIADVTITVPASSTARIQEAHRTALHALCGLIEDELAPGDSPRGSDQ